MECSSGTGDADDEDADEADGKVMEREAPDLPKRDWGGRWNVIICCCCCSCNCCCSWNICCCIVCIRMYCKSGVTGVMGVIGATGATGASPRRRGVAATGWAAGTGWISSSWTRPSTTSASASGRACPSSKMNRSLEHPAQVVRMWFLQKVNLQVSQVDRTFKR